jgi:hypothetical protein
MVSTTQTNMGRNQMFRCLRFSLLPPRRTPCFSPIRNESVVCAIAHEREGLANAFVTLVARVLDNHIGPAGVGVARDCSESQGGAAAGVRW